MAHKVKLRLHTNVVASKDVEIEVHESSGKLGTLLISKGNIEWLPAWKSIKKHRLRWVKFAELMEREGKPTRAKR
jgi:hypothetical protein